MSLLPTNRKTSLRSLYTSGFCNFRCRQRYRPQAETRRDHRPECGRVRGGYYSGRPHLGAPF
jgi:hypothetical protein